MLKEIYTKTVLNGFLEHSEYCINILGKNYKTYSCCLSARH